MAKLGFKDIIMKYLKKDEAFKLKYAMNPNQKIAVATYNDRADAEKFVSDIIKKGGKAILTQEDAPANATGTAVAGTGDDSSTVVVKKKKDQQKKLMKRMGITEAIDKAIPDLEYPKDEIRERTDQLKELASQSEEFKLKFTDPANKKKFHIVYRSKGEAEAKMAQLKRDGVKEIEIVREDLDAQPQDKDVKKVKGTQPKKYYKKLDKDTKKKRAAFFKKKAGTYKKSDDDDDYKPAPGDEKAKTKPSTFTKKFKQMYGDNYGYTAMHAKGVAKLNPLRRKDESK
jgi:hypothetical protein